MNYVSNCPSFNGYVKLTNTDALKSNTNQDPKLIKVLSEHINEIDALMKSPRDEFRTNEDDCVELTFNWQAPPKETKAKMATLNGDELYVTIEAKPGESASKKIKTPYAVTMSVYNFIKMTPIRISGYVDKFIDEMREIKQIDEIFQQTYSDLNDKLILCRNGKKGFCFTLKDKIDTKDEAKQITSLLSVASKEMVQTSESDRLSIDFKDDEKDRMLVVFRVEPSESSIMAGAKPLELSYKISECFDNKDQVEQDLINLLKPLKNIAQSNSIIDELSKKFGNYK